MNSQVVRFGDNLKEKSRGQMLLIVILTIVVALTVGLAVVSRTVVNLKSSKQNEESQRAFQAAQAGIEEAIKQVQTSSGGPTSTSFTPSTPFSNNSTYTTNITVTNTARTILVNSGTPLVQDSGGDVWLSHYPNYNSSLSRSVDIYWVTAAQTTCSGSGQSIEPALEILVLSGTFSAPNFDKYIAEANCSGRIPGVPGSGGTTGVLTSSAVSFTIGGVTLYRKVTIPAFSNGYIMKIIPIFNSGVVGVDAPNPGPPLPSQGVTIQSTGTSGDTVRKIQYFMSFPQIPVELFPYSLVSQN